MAAMLGGGYVNYFGLDGRSYEVIPQVQQRSRLNTDQRRRHGAADIAHLQAELRRLVAVNHHGRLRPVDLEVGEEKDEHATLDGFLQKLLRDVVQPVEGIGRIDDELHRQSLRARERRQLEGYDAQTG